MQEAQRDNSKRSEGGPTRAGSPSVKHEDPHMNTKNLIRWAGLAALVAGMCFVGAELLRPPVVLESLTTTRWAIVHALAIAMSLFGLPGVMGIYARQADAAGRLG